jgi:hypothetical protein
MATFVGVSVYVRRHEHNMSVADAPLGNDVLGERLHLGAGALQHGHLETAVMIEVNMQRRLGEAVVVVEVLGQPLRQLACGMIVDIRRSRSR